MDCQSIADNMSRIVYGKLTPSELSLCRRHLALCADCTDAVRGAEALALLRQCGPEDIPEGLFDTLSSALRPADPPPVEQRPRFWHGAAIGGAVAASLFAALLTVGALLVPAVSTDSGPATFAVTLSEPRIMDVAIEADRALEDAEISVLLSGGVALDGFGDRRELTWRSNLEAGVNRLRLPVIAVNGSGGKMVVRLTHPQSEQVYVVNLDAEA